MSEGLALELAVELLRAARRIVVFSGAGLSRASGIPTYRDADGLWMNQSAVRFSHVDDLERDPAGFSKFWAQRLSVVEAARPNPGHLALAQLQLGEAYDRLGRRDLARAAYQAALALAPERDPARVRTRAQAGLRRATRTE